MAANSDSTTDSFGDTSDWIELYNDSSATIDLSQYHLTDDAADLEQYALPAVNLLAGESILVFASGRDLVTAGGEIHTSFSLASSGEYLALTDNNGVVLQDFGTTFPAQFDDVSYGIEMFSSANPTSIISPAASAQLLIPNGTTGPALGLNWTATAFNDASWTSATLPIGYESGNGYQGIINTNVSSNTNSAYLRIPFNLSSLSSTNNLTLNVKYDDGFVAYLNGQYVFDDRAPANATWDSQATSNHSDGQAVIYQSFDLSSARQYLQTGQNVLAIHALNYSPNSQSSDFLFEATLEGSGAGIVTPVQEGFFSVPTPGSGNGATFDGFSEPVVFGVPHGFYTSTFSLPLATSSGTAKIVYTTDGSDPTVGANLNTTNGTTYTGPISISQTTVIRAAAFELNKVPALSEARTFIFTGDVINQSPNHETPGPGWPAQYLNDNSQPHIDYGIDQDLINTYGAQAVRNALESISTFSIVTDVDNLFDSNTGIYVNAQNRGRNWERFSSVELIEPDGSPGFQVNAGLRIRGGYSRNNQFPKRSFRLFFRGEYGASKLEYDFFGGDGAEKFDVIDLRTSQNYAWHRGSDDRNTMLREVFGRDAQRDMDHVHTRSRYHHLYLNGVYWGIYQTQERVEAFFGESYLGGDKEDYDRVKNNNANGYRTETADGNDTDWQQLFNLAQQLADNPSGNANNYWAMQGLNPNGTRNIALPVLLDVDNLIDYQMIIFHTGGFDSSISNFLGNDKANNWVAIRNRQSDDHGFQFFIHDNEHSMGTNGNSNDRTGPYYSSNDSQYIWFNPGFLHQDLMVHEEYRLAWHDRVQKHFFNDGALTYQNNIDRLEVREAELAPAVIAEAARWGDTRTGNSPALDHQDWQAAVNDVKSWLGPRNNTLLAQLLNDDLHSSIAPATFNQHGGVVNSGFNATLNTSAGNSTIYYTIDGSDPRLPGGGLSSSAMQYSSSIPINDLTRIQARVRLNNGDWSAINDATFRLPATPASSSNLRVTEINYHPLPPTSLELATNPAFTEGSFEYIEFRNTSNTDVDLTGAQITSPINYTFPAFTLAPNQSAVLARDQAAFALRYNAIPTIGEYGDAVGLSNDGDLVTIVAADGSTIQSFTYNDSNNWPSLADGAGHSMEVVDVAGNYNDPLNWVPSRTTAGSPSFAGEPSASTTGLRITEVNYNPNVVGAEFIEIVNESNAAINLSGVRLVEGVDFDFTNSSVAWLQPGELVLVVRDVVDFTSKYGGGLPVAGQFAAGSLANSGERIILFDSTGDIVHDFVYDDVSPWPTVADGAGSSLEIVSTSGSYSSAANWQSSSIAGGTPGSLGGALPCDYVGGIDGCDHADIDALYAGTNGAASPLTSALIAQWLVEASDAANPLKTDAADVYVYGDVDLSGDVDSTDLGLLLNNFSVGNGLGWGSGNLDTDGVVDSTDLGLLLNNFGFASVAVAATAVSVPVPESPTSFALQSPSGSFPLSSSDGFSVRDLVFGTIDAFDEDDEQGVI